jgi:hypothetical protein
MSNAAYLKHVFSSRDSNGLCDIADEVERHYGFGICVVSLGTFGSYGSALYIDSRFPTAGKAFDYARDLIVSRTNSQ